MFILTAIIIGFIIYGTCSLLARNVESNNSNTIDSKRTYYENNEITKSFIKPNYRTGERKTYIGSNGYVYFLDSNKLVHRWAMEKSLGRRLRREEVVHHIDGDKLNNRIENLRLFSNQEEHDKFHREHLKNYGTWYEEIPEYVRQY